MTMPKLTSFISLIVLLAGLSFSCKKKNNEDELVSDQKVNYDLLEIQSTGVIKALVDNSTTSYFIYKGTPMGFEYELLQRFAQALKVDLKIVPVKNLDFIIDSLKVYQGDIIAANLTVTKERSQEISFSSPLLLSKQVLVQRFPKNESEDELFVNSLSDLIDKEVYVRKNSSFFKRIQHLSEEIGGDVIIKQAPGNMTVEELIAQVSNEEINYTIADEHVAKINRSFYRNIHIKTPISLEQKIAWAVRKESSDLLIALNAWLKEFKKTTDFRVIYLKYFGNTSLYKSRLNSDLFAIKSGNISPYDDIIKDEARLIAWDWRLLAALIYQESQFDHNVVSWAGAYGLMQLMPETAHEYGIDSSSDPKSNIHAGISYLKWLDQQFEEKVPDSIERSNFVLAAYNVGLGHVYDAMRLAEKYNLKNNVWDKNVSEMLLNKSKPEYYNDSVVYYGYCRGKEPYNYVREIMGRFEHYRNMVAVN